MTVAFGFIVGGTLGYLTGASLGLARLRIRVRQTERRMDLTEKEVAARLHPHTGAVQTYPADPKDPA